MAPGSSEASALPWSSDGPGVRVDRDRCIGAGLCVLAAPDVFDQSEEDGLVVVLGATRPDPGDDAVREAVRRCPSGALSTEPS